MMVIDPGGAEPCSRSFVNILGRIYRPFRRRVSKCLASASSLSLLLSNQYRAIEQDFSNISGIL